MSALGLRLDAVRGGTPVGALVGGTGAALGAMVSLFGLDALPLPLCVFKAVTGLPCFTCGSTRAVARLVRLDLAGAFAWNPLVVSAAFVVAAWALADLALATRGRALAVSVPPPVARVLRVLAVLAVLANWVYLVRAGV